MKIVYKQVEQGLIDAILRGEFPAGAPLQSERELAERFGVNRATIREAQEHLAQAGWITVSPRKATIVNDFWANGTLDIISSMARSAENFPQQLAVNLLEIRAELAPHYTRLAVQNDAEQLIACLAKARKLADTPSAVAKFDWELHRTMAILSGNRFYPLLLNSFAKLYFRLRGQFFATEEFRAQARGFYQKLMHAAITEDADTAGDITRSAMNKRLHIFRRQLEEQATREGAA